MAAAGSIDFYGYDVDGRKTNSGLDAPRQPRFFSSCLENTIRDDHFTLSFGGRFERYDLRMPQPRDDRNLPLDFNLNWLDESRLVPQKALNVFLPRLNTALHFGESTHLYFAYGQYAGMPPLHELYLSPLGLVRALIRPADGGFWFLDGIAPAHHLKPEHSAHYEAGLSQRLNSNFTLGVNVFYRDLRDQAQGNGSNPLPNGGALAAYFFTRQPFYPEFSSPLDYDQTHRGALLLDWRFNENDGPLLNGTSLAALLTFNTGHPYSRQQQEFLGTASPWNWAVHLLNDPRAQNAAESPNSSRTPVVFNVDLRLSRNFAFGKLQAEFYGNVLNLFNRRHVLNVYPLTGNSRADGWFESDLSRVLQTPAIFADFYNAINRDNRWAYMQAAGHDLFGAPRQIRVGINIKR